MRTINWFATALLGLASTATAQTLSFDVGGWRGHVHAGKSGTPSYCSMEPTRHSSSNITFFMPNDEQLGLFITNNDWKFADSGTYKIRFIAEDNREMTVTARRISDDKIVYVFEDDIENVIPVTEWYRLRVDSEGKSLSFDLKGISAALSELVRCANQNTGAAENASQSPTAHEREPGTPRPEIILEAVRVFMDLVSETGLTGVQLLPELERPVHLRHLPVVWLGNGVAGTIQITEKQTGATADTISSSLIHNASSGCEGKFTSGSTREGDGRTHRAFASCEVSPSSGYRVGHIVTARPQGGYYTFSVMNTSGSIPDKADEAERKILRAIHRIVPSHP
ncbi:MAG TPA: hypothetical protein VEY95_14100 [Azospirillaceae bacterium]|nr:hypothetical protein [Azospirillaceae bacterium]